MRRLGCLKVALAGAFVLAAPTAAFAQVGEEETEIEVEEEPQQDQGQQGQQGQQPQGQQPQGQQPQGQQPQGQQPQGQQDQQQQGQQPGQMGGQQGGGQQQQGGGQQFGSQGASAQDVAVQGTVRGVVQSVNLAQGTVTIKTGQGTMQLKAKPTQIAGLRKGEQFVAGYANFGDQQWLVENLDAGANRDFGRTVQLTGNIVSLDKSTGMLTLSTAGKENIKLRAHPAEIEQLLPGQYISLTYQRIGNTQWITQIQSGQEKGAAQQ